MPCLERESTDFNRFHHDQLTIIERTISSLASFIAVNAKTKTKGKIVVTGAKELICGMS